MHSLLQKAKKKINMCRKRGPLVGQIAEQVSREHE